MKNHLSRRRLRTATLASAAMFAGVAAPAQAHGIGSTSSPGLPAWLFAWGAAAVLAVSFASLGSRWRTPQLERAEEHRIGAVPGWLDPLCGVVGVVAFLGLIYAGLAGAQDSLDNVLPTWVFVVFWVAVPVTSGVLGDVFQAFNPWRAVARGLRLVTRSAGVTVPEPMRYPAKLGCWPAVATIVAFGWLELAYADRDDPSTLALLSLAYATAQLLAMSVFGIDAWERHGDGFSVYFRLFSRLSPLVWRDGALWRRRPLAGAAALMPVPGTVALICVGLG